MASGWKGWDQARPRLAAIPAAVKTALRPVMEQGARDITAMQRALVPVEPAPGVHAKGSRHEPAHSAGTEKNAIGWEWRGFKIVISAVARAIPNLGLWIEKGTRPGKRGGSYLASGFVAGKHGRRQRRNYARKVYRTHPGTAPHPFFLPAWYALLPGIRDKVAAVWAKAVGNQAQP